MFNHRHQHSHTITVHEHRAPTDDSIRLATEMLDKARKTVALESIQGTNVVANVLRWRSEEREEQMMAFDLNGTRIVIGLDQRMLTEPAPTLRETLARAIAERILHTWGPAAV